MTFPPRRLLVVPLLLLLLPLAAVPAHAESSAQVRRRLEQLTTRLAAAESAEALAADELAKLDRRLARTEAEIAALQSRLGDRARAAYISGMTAEPLVTLVTSDNPMTAVDRLALLEAATLGQEELVRRSAALRRTLRIARRQAAEARQRLTAVRTRLATGRRELATLLDRVVAEEQAAAERAAREAARLAARRAAARRAAAAAARRAARLAAVRASRARTAPSGRYACLVGPAHAYTDTYGAPRSGGRRHQGVDVFAPYGSPVYAVTDGVVTRAGSNRLGGLVLYLRGNDGDEYYYAHNSANLVGSGTRVRAGEQIARVGTSGNAQGTSPHVHFEVHPGGGAPVNPYPFVRRTCG